MNAKDKEPQSTRNIQRIIFPICSILEGLINGLYHYWIDATTSSNLSIQTGDTMPNSWKGIFSMK